MNAWTDRRPGQPCRIAPPVSPYPRVVHLQPNPPCFFGCGDLKETAVGPILSLNCLCILVVIIFRPQTSGRTERSCRMKLHAAILRQHDNPRLENRILEPLCQQGVCDASVFAPSGNPREAQSHQSAGPWRGKSEDSS